MNSKAFETSAQTVVPISDDVIERLFNTYADMIFRLAYVRTGSQSDSDDIVQEVFLRMLQSGSIFDDEEHQKAWLIRAAINRTNSLMTSAYRKNTVRDGVLPEDAGDGGQAQTTADQKADVMSAVMRLPVKMRTAVHLFYYQGYRINEIAEMTGARENTVKSWLSRARKALGEYLKEADI